MAQKLDHLRWTQVAPAAGGAAAGAALMYLFDPDRGRRRRAHARDKTVHAGHVTADSASAAARDARNRSLGIAHNVRKRWHRQPPKGQALVARVRAELARVCRHPSALRVEARDSIVTISGPILRAEVEEVRAAARAVAGVDGIEDRLEIHETPGNIPALQGSGKLDGGPRPEYLQETWAPAPRVLAGAAGGALAAYGLVRHDAPGVAASVAGALVFTRAATNLPLQRVTGIGAHRDAVVIQKSIGIDAPVDTVWAFWDNYENFPSFMSHVRNVTVGADGRSHWKVEGPLGATIEWDAEVTQREPHKVLAWKTCPGTAIEHSGIVYFEPADGLTRVHVKLSYNPIAGAAGHAIASLLGANPRKRLDDDLLRLKSTIETGVPPRDAARPG